MEDEYCPFCDMVHSVLIAVDSARTNAEKFDILHSVLDQVKAAGYKEGYADALLNQIQFSEHLLDAIEDDDKVLN